MNAGLRQFHRKLHPHFIQLWWLRNTQDKTCLCLFLPSYHLLPLLPCPSSCALVLPSSLGPSWASCLCWRTSYRCRIPYRRWGQGPQPQWLLWPTWALEKWRGGGLKAGCCLCSLIGNSSDTIWVRGSIPTEVRWSCEVFGKSPMYDWCFGFIHL